MNRYYTPNVVQTQFDCDTPPRPADLSGAVVFMACYDDRPEYLVLQTVVTAPDVVFVDEER